MRTVKSAAIFISAFVVSGCCSLPDNSNRHGETQKTIPANAQSQGGSVEVAHCTTTETQTESAAEMSPAVASAAEIEKEQPEAGVTRLEPFMINESNQLSFHFSIRVMRAQPGNHVVSMNVDRVLAGSDADQGGLKSGMQIFSSNGKPVEQYEATFLNGSELNRIFIGRREGDQVTLVVAEAGETSRKKIVVTRRTMMWLRSW